MGILPMINREKIPSAKKLLDSTNSLPPDYGTILEEIRGKIKAAQLRALTAVNQELISLYREIGRIIHNQQQEGS